jgi:hypothetical protein
LFRVSWRRLRRQRRPLSKKILTGWLLFEFRLVHLTNNFFICSPITSKSMGRPGHVKDRSPTVRVFALFRVSWRRLRRQRRPLSKKILTGWLLFEFRLVHLTNNFFICSPITSKSMGRPGHVKDRSPTVRVFALFRVSWRRLRRQRRPLSKKILTGWLLFEFRLVHLTNNFFIRPPIVLESMGRPRHM